MSRILLLALLACVLASAGVVRSLSAAALTSVPGSSAAPGTRFRECRDCPEIIVVPGGGFMMGSPATEPGRFADEGPQHQVVIPRAFAAGVYDVTRAEYAAFVRHTGRPTDTNCKAYDGKRMVKTSGRNWRNPGFPQTSRDPVVCVSWRDAQAYIGWLNKQVTRHPGASEPGAPGPYRLPSEAEWEYAARAGTTTPFYWGEEISRAKANYGPDQLAFAPVAQGADRWLYTSPAGSFPPNGFGLFDIAGNVWQMTQDCWRDSYLGAPANGSAWMTGDCMVRVLRGGSWYKPPAGERSAKRGKGTPEDLEGSDEIGFRVARALD